MINFCNKCGKKVIKQANKYCSYCGAELVSSEEMKWRRLKEFLTNSKSFHLSDIASTIQVDIKTIEKKLEKKQEGLNLEGSILFIEDINLIPLYVNFFLDVFRVCPKCNLKTNSLKNKFCKDCGALLLPKEDEPHVLEVNAIPLDQEIVVRNEEVIEKELSFFSDYFALLEDGKVNINDFVEMLKTDRTTLLKKLLEWKNQISVKIDGDLLKITPQEIEKFKELIKNEFL